MVHEPNGMIKVFLGCNVLKAEDQSSHAVKGGGGGTFVAWEIKITRGVN